MSEQSFNQIRDSEISLKVIINFLFDSWKSMVVAGLLGVLASIGYVIISPNEYQATAQIQMAQISSNNNANSSLINAEDPNILMIRLKLPTTYSTEDIKKCDFENTSFPAESLASSLKLSTFKGAGSIIELKINRYSKESAINCAQALFENIKIFQYNKIKPRVEESKDLLIKYEKKLSALQSFLSKADKLDAASAAIYLATREEVNFLTNEVISLDRFILTANLGQTKLIAPIYVNSAPVFPKKKVSLMVGLIAGLFLGLLFMAIKKSYTKYKTT